MTVDTDQIQARWDRVTDRNRVRAHFGRRTRRIMQKGKR